MNIPFTTNHRLFQLPTQLQCNRLFRRHFVTTPNPYRSESELHRRTKEYIAEKLNEVDKLDVEIFCDLPGRWFRCRNSRIIKGWAKRWERVETEYHIANVGRLDVAVLYPQRKTRTRSKPLTDMLYWMRDDSKPFDVQARSFLDRFLKGKERVFTFPSSLNATERKTVHEICDQLSLQHYSSGNSLRTLKVIKPDDIISPIEPSGDLTGFAAIEVLVSSAMTQSKVDLLNDSQIPWIEVKAEESMYSGRHPWNPKTPLPVYRTNQSYHCTECAEKFQNSLRIKQMMLVDIYPGGTKSGFAFVQRRLFTILEKKNLGIPNSENLGIPSSEESRKFEQEYFLTESGINVTNYIHIKDLEPFLLGRSRNMSDLHKQWKNRVLKFQDEGDDFDIRVNWPGRPPEEIFSDPEIPGRAFDDPTNFYVILDRFFALLRTWNPLKGSWIPNEK